MATAVDNRLGSLVDERYKILESMDSGSMGVVYKAERVPVGKLVAIKFLHASYANDTEFLSRFERETRVMSKLAHPNCVSVVDFGVWQGTPYLVMEFVAGRTLRKIMDEGALPAVRALALARQIVSGLAHAHAQGITHRDIKPANIMITEEIGTGEHVRILDFGLARLRGATGRDATQANVVVGTPNYMAPEQTIGGGIIDERTDIYAVGIVLFEMVAGERPFQADDTLTLLGMHRAAPVPRLADRLPKGTELPEGLQAVIDRAMAKSPGDRFPSAIALAEAIAAMIGRPVAAPGPTGYPVAKPPSPEPAGTAPTLLDAGSRSAVATVITQLRPSRERTSEERTVEDLTAERPFAPVSLPPPRRRSSSSSRAGILLALLVLGGGAYAAYYVQNKSKTRPPAALEGGALAQAEPAESGSGSGSGSGETPDQAGSGSGSGSGAGSAGTAAAGSGAAPDPSGAGGSAAAGAGSGEPAAGAGSDSAPGAGEGSGSAAPAGEVEPVPSPAEATNPDPAGGGSAEDEDENAPKTQADVEKRTKPPAAPVLATTINGAVKLIQDGKRDLALASLQALEQKQPKSAYTAFLLGNLYFDQRWWSVAMDYYRAAIHRNGGYRTNAVLIRNVIRTLISKKTDRKAEVFLKRAIGRPALPYLQQTARTDPNPYLRKYAGALARQIR
jgi:serine/threonine protein kinase